MSSYSQRYKEFYELVRNNIFAFARYALNFNPTKQQAEALKKIQDETFADDEKKLKRVAIKSGQGTGKTSVSNVIGLWRSYRHVRGLTVVTAPTGVQCRDVWLVECSRIITNSHPFIKKHFQIYKTKILFGNDDKWGIWTRTANKAENFQGYHDKNLTFIVDEASGVDREIIRTIMGTLTNKNSLLVKIGNPNTRDCSFYDCFNSLRHMWHTVTFNAEESPLVSKDNIQRIKDEFGEDSDVYRVRVLGEFPNMDPECFMSSEDLEACSKIDPYVAAFDYSIYGNRKQVGLDIARFGDDESVYYIRCGNAIIKAKIFSKVDPNVVIEDSFKEQLLMEIDNKNITYVCDADGMGQGVMNNFYRTNRSIYEFKSARNSFKPQVYKDAITEAYFHVAKLVKTRSICIPKDGKLIQQLSTRRYKIDRKLGTVVIEPKDEYKKRTHGESPDRADALVMAFWPHAGKGGKVSEVLHTPRVAGSVIR